MEHTITFDYEYIRNQYRKPLTDDECACIARLLKEGFGTFTKETAQKYRLDNPCVHDGVPVKARVSLQSENDHGYIYEVKELFFDCHLVLDQFKLSELPMYADDLHDKGVLDCGDELFYEAVCLDLTRGWDGPFDFYIDDDDAYQDYLARRVKDEYGYEITDRDEDEDEDW